MLPFSPPRWEAEQDELIALDDLAPRVAEGAAPSAGGGAPAPSPWRTMGLSGLTPEELGVHEMPQGAARPGGARRWWGRAWGRARARRDALLEWGLGLWDQFLLQTGFDRVPPAHLALIALALLGSLMLGRHLGHAARLDPAEVEGALRQALRVGDVSRAERVLEEARGDLPAESLPPLEALVGRERLYQTSDAAARAAAQAGDPRSVLTGVAALPPDHPRAVALAPLAQEARRRLTETLLVGARQHLWRGELASARAALDEAAALAALAPLAPAPLAPAPFRPLAAPLQLLRFALALHAAEPALRDLTVNPSPSEQRALERAAQQALSGDREGAARELRGATPQAGARRALFELRLRALEAPAQVPKALKAARAKRQYGEALRLSAAPFVLGSAPDTADLRDLYAEAIRASIAQRQYVEVAPWLTLALTLAPGDGELTQIQRQLAENARAWVTRAEAELARGDLKEVQTLLRAAEGFLGGEDLARARALRASAGLR